MVHGNNFMLVKSCTWYVASAQVIPSFEVSKSAAIFRRCQRSLFIYIFFSFRFQGPLRNTLYPGGKRYTVDPATSCFCNDVADNIRLRSNEAGK